MQGAHFCELGAFHLGFRAFNSRKNLACADQQMLTRRSQKDMPLIPIEQTGTDFLLECPDLNAERRLGDMQNFGSAGKAQFLSDRNEIS
jgi:hypothetical protein